MYFNNRRPTQSSKLADFAHSGPRPKPFPARANLRGGPNYNNNSETSTCDSSSHDSNPHRLGIPSGAIKCTCKKQEGSDGPKLLNVDAMDELCYFVKNNDDDKYDCYQVCKCCGVMTKYENEIGDDPTEPTPVKYARRQRFTFNDGKIGSRIVCPPFPFKCPILNCSLPGKDPCAECCREDAQQDGLPSKTGVYYFDRTKNKLVFQSRKDTEKKKSKDTPSAPPSSCGDSSEADSEISTKPAVVIQPYVVPPPAPPNGGCGNQNSNPYGNQFAPNPPMPPTINPFAGFGGPSGNLYNTNGGGFNPMNNNPCGQFCNSCCPPPLKPCTPPRPIIQETIIPMCIPVHPPPFCPPPCPQPETKKKGKRKDSRRQRKSSRRERTSSLPQSSYPSTSYPSSYPSNSYPSASYPSTNNYSNSYPSKSYPSNSNPSKSYPSKKSTRSSYKRNSEKRSSKP